MERGIGASAGTGRDGAAFALIAVRAGLDAPPFDLSIVPGEGLALLGDRADILSALLDRIAGLAPSLGGRIAAGGRDVTLLPPGRRGVALVSRRDPLFPNMDLRDNVAFALRATGATRDAARAGAARMIALTGLEGLESARPGTLTRAQAIRAAVARALGTGNAVLLLDDPFHGLEESEGRRLASLLATLRRALGLAVIQAVPRREEALRAGGRVALFRGARMIQCASAAILYERPASPDVAAFFGEANVLPGRILALSPDDVARVRLACGATVEAVAPGEGPEAEEPLLAEGDECVVCVPPDRISPFFGPFPDDGSPLAGEDGLSPVRGAVIDAVHLGDHVRLRVRCEDGSEIELRRPPLTGGRLPRPGASVHLAWPPGHAALFPLRPDLY